MMCEKKSINRRRLGLLSSPVVLIRLGSVLFVGLMIGHMSATQDSRACTVSGSATTLNDRPKSAYPEDFRVDTLTDSSINRLFPVITRVR